MMKSEVINLIHNIRGTQVMLDSDLASLFEVETKVFNQAVKRNNDRFPDTFRFQLSKEEYDTLRSQTVTSGKNETVTPRLLKDSNDLRSQVVTSNAHGGRRYLPYAFTEQGVAMLTSILRSGVAIEMSIKIMTAFVEMRKLISSNALLLNRIDSIETRQLVNKKESDEKFDQLFNALQGEVKKPKENIFFDGEIYDAYSFIIQLIMKAEAEIILIDNYVDNSVLDMFSKKKNAVNVRIITHRKTKLLATDVQKFNQQYPILNLDYSDKFHDRFLMIDNRELYHIGASLKDAGKKGCAFVLMEDKGLINNLLNRL